MKQDKIYIYGKHAVSEALRHSPHVVKKIYLSPRHDDGELKKLIDKSGISTAVLEQGRVQGVDSNATHQGVIGVVSVDGIMLSLKEFLHNLKVTDDTSLVLMSELQDPHNVGAVIRSAAAFGAAGVLMPEHNQAPVSGAVIKVSAGMAFRVPLVQIGNINQAIRDLKDAGFTIYGLEGEGGEDITKKKFDSPSVIIIGNEGEGIRMKTKELCDSLLAIPIHPKCESLNAAASTAIALYAWSVHHSEALKKGK